MSHGALFLAALGLAVFSGPAAAQTVDVSTPPAAAADPSFEAFDDEFAKPQSKPARDPLRAYNRGMFWFNDKFYTFLGKPLTRGYGFIAPQRLRVAIAKGFVNLAFPIRFVGSLMQLKLRGAGRELTRFTINSTLGVGGLFDPADHFWRIKPSDEDIGQALGAWGVGEGFPVVLPLLGQTNLRDGLCTIPNFLLNPVYYVADGTTYLSVSAGDKFNYLSLHGKEYEKIKEEALDPYSFIRDAHRQYRDEKIKE